MKRPTRFGSPLLMIVLAVFVCAGAWGAGQIRAMRDKGEVAKIMTHTRTVCVGRFLIDVPADAEVSLSYEMMGGFDITTREESQAAFRERIDAREADIRSRGPAIDGSGGMVAANALNIPGMTGRSFVYGRNRGYLMRGEDRIDDEFMSVEAHAHMNWLSILLSMKVAQEADARAAMALLARLRLRSAQELPAVPGFCISRAVFAEPIPPHETEHIIMHIGLAGHPDLRMTFASLPGGGDDQGLLARVAQADAEAGPEERLRVTALRSGRRKIDDVPGEESLESFRGMNSAKTFNFMWEARGVDNDPLRPYVLFELQAGVGTGEPPAGASPHEDAILALWDAISSSIRLRPDQAPQRP